MAERYLVDYEMYVSLLQVSSHAYEPCFSSLGYKNMYIRRVF